MVELLQLGPDGRQVVQQRHGRGQRAGAHLGEPVEQVGQRVGDRQRGPQAGDEKALSDQFGEHAGNPRPVGSEVRGQRVNKGTESHRGGCRVPGPHCGAVPHVYPAEAGWRFQPPAAANGEVGERHIHTFQQVRMRLQPVDDVGQPLRVDANHRPMGTAPPHPRGAAHDHWRDAGEQPERGGATERSQQVAGGGHCRPPDLSGLPSLTAADRLDPASQPGAGLPDGVGEIGLRPDLPQPRATRLRIVRVGPPAGRLRRRPDRGAQQRNPRMPIQRPRVTCPHRRPLRGFGSERWGRGLLPGPLLIPGSRRKRHRSGRTRRWWSSGWPPHRPSRR